MRFLLLRYASLPILLCLCIILSANSITFTDRHEKIMNLGDKVNSTYNDYLPYVSPNENLLYMTSDRPSYKASLLQADTQYYQSRIWKIPMLHREGNLSFGYPTIFDSKINNRIFNGLVSVRYISDSDYHIYFTSLTNHISVNSNTDILVAHVVNSEVETVKVIHEISTGFNERMPYISSDGTALFFSSDRPGGYGEDDIWVSTYNFTQKTWNVPANLGQNVNTPNSEISPSIHHNNSLFFSSNKEGGIGGYDIYVTQKNKRIPDLLHWDQAKNISLPYNSPWDDERPVFTHSTQYFYFCSNRAGGYGGYDIYKAKVPLIIKPHKTITLQGRIYDHISQVGIKANIQVLNYDTEINISSILPLGRYSVKLRNSDKYQIIVSALGYQTQVYHLDFQDQVSDIDMIEKNFLLDTKNNMKSHKMMQDKMSPTHKMMQDKMSPTHKMMQDKMSPTHKMMQDKMSPTHKMMQDKMSPTHKMMQDKMSPTHKMMQDKMSPTHKMMIHDSMHSDSQPMAIILFKRHIYNKLIPNEEAKIRTLFTRWKQNPQHSFQLRGHSARKEKKDRKKDLSKKRAMYVKERLLLYDIPEERIQLNWYADKRPAMVENTIKKSELNQRVEIFLLK